MKSNLAPTIAAGLLFLGSLAQADTFYIAKSGVNSITKYDDNGNGSSFTSTFVDGPTASRSTPSATSTSRRIATRSRNFPPSGTNLGIFASTALNNATGLAFDTGGNLYAANFDGNTIEKFAPDGADPGFRTLSPIPCSSSTTLMATSSPSMTIGRTRSRPRSKSRALAPTNDLEAAIVMILTPGAYTAKAARTPPPGSAWSKFIICTKLIAPRPHGSGGAL